MCKRNLAACDAFAVYVAGRDYSTEERIPSRKIYGQVYYAARDDWSDPHFLDGTSEHVKYHDLISVDDIVDEGLQDAVKSISPIGGADLEAIGLAS